MFGATSCLRSLQLHIQSRSASLSGTIVSVLCSEELPIHDEKNVIHTVSSYFCEIGFNGIFYQDQSNPVHQVTLAPEILEMCVVN